MAFRGDMLKRWSRGAADSATSVDAEAAEEPLDSGRCAPWPSEYSFGGQNVGGSRSVLGPRSEGARTPSRKGRSPAKGSQSKKKSGLLSEAELASIEERYAIGITAVDVVEIFSTRGVRLSEATFRKYVQQGLLPRSRRVGRKGKHRGSMGLYPPKTVRRVNTIKQLMLEGYTIDEIQEHFLRFADLVEGVEEGLGELFDSLGQVIGGPRFDDRVKKSLTKELTDARRLADELLERVGALAETAAEPPTDRYRGSGAAGSAEELL